MLRFTIRDLLWLMVVVGMGAAWVVDHKRQAAEIAKRDLLGIETPEPFIPPVGDVKSN